MGFEKDMFDKIKLVIWDLDETFWKGTLSEGEVSVPEENIKLIKCLADHGIVNSISSKNDEAPVLKKLEESGVGSLFVFNDINWNDKGPQIKDKLLGMGLRAENTLFIDDNPRNLQEAKHYSPEIMTTGPDILPDLSEYFRNIPESDRDHRRLEQYKILEKKTSAEKTSTSKEDFLFGSEIKVTINKNCLEELDRIHDMVQRTNQLNYTKNRDDKKLLEKILTNDWNESGYVSVRDRFGDYGIVGFYCYNKREKSMEHFLFSCRVLGMGVEQFIYNKLGCPDFEVKEPVASVLEKNKEIPWITEDTESEIRTDKTAGNRVRVLLKGPCDMSAIEPYLAGGSITTEFNYVNNSGFVTTGQNHSMHIYQKAVLPDEEIQEIIKDVPFITDGDFETKLFENEYHVICYSLLQDLAAGLYRNKKTGKYISFSSRNYDLTDPAFAQRFINKEIQGHNFDFTPEIINKFSEDWEFVGNTPIDLLLRNLDYIYEHVPGKPIFILLLGSETDCDKRSEEFAGMAEIYREINPIMEEFAMDHDRMRIINPTPFIHSQDDFEDCINHFSRNVYYEIAGKVCDHINEAVEIIKKERNIKSEKNVNEEKKPRGRRGLLFRTSEICNNTLNIFSDIIASKLKNKGIDCGFVDLNKTGEELAEEYIREMNAGFDFALTFNSVGQHETTMSGQNVFEYMNVPFYNWIVDHPCEHTEDIESDLRNYHIICLDRDHKKYLDNYFPKLAGSHFIPLGGTKWLGGGAYDLESFKNREFDVVFTGGLFSLEDLERKMMEYPDDIKELAFCMIEYMIDNRSATNEAALKYALDVNGITADTDAFRRYGFLTAKTNPYIRSYVREEQIRYLMAQGVKIDIFGDGWERIEDRGNAVIHKPVSYVESVELSARSKISLNIMPWFKDGLHDRIPTAQLNGSAVLTDGSRYISELYNTESGSSRELILFDINHPEKTAEIINEALSDPDELYRIACRGKSKAEKLCTWEKRADELTGVIYGDFIKPADTVGRYDEEFIKEEIRGDFLVDTKRKKIWYTELKILEEFDRFCKTYGLKYYADFGTLLGAVRHKGFIPWDDDIDLTMPRPDYQKMLELGPGFFKQPFFLQNYYTDHHNNRVTNFSRIRDSRTTLFEGDDEGFDGYNQGIFIDIFPLDIADDPSGNIDPSIKVAIDLWEATADPRSLLEKIIGGYRPEAGIDVMLDVMGAPYEERLKLFENILAGSYDRAPYIGCFGSMFKRRSINKEWYGEPIMLPFENIMIPAPAEYDKILTIYYKDYMTPVKFASVHTASFVDPDRPYYEYTGKAKQE